MTEIKDPSTLRPADPPIESEDPDAALDETHLSEPTRSATEVRRVLVDWLSAHGMTPRMDEDGDLAFQHEGLALFLMWQPEDAEFFVLLLPGVFHLGHEYERSAVLSAINAANGRIKVAKLALVDQRVNAMIELFAAEPEHLVAVMPRALRALKAAVAEFAEDLLQRQRPARLN